MPSWPVHIKIGKNLNKILNLGDDFILGNIMPDALNGFIIKDISNPVNHKITHYNKSRKMNLDIFLKEYEETKENPIILGYLTHLLTDLYFNLYTLKHHTKKINNKTYPILKDGNIDYKNKHYLIKQKDFYKYGQHLISQKQLGCPITKTDKTTDFIMKLNYKVNDNDIDIIINKVNSIISQEVHDNVNYKMFTKDELDKLTDKCTIYILEFLNKLKLK